MQEFLTNDTVNCNLMSLTGYRTLVILDLLMHSPKTNDEINDYFLNHKYIKEKFSNDTLRIYINSLRAIGCKITRADKLNKKYELLSHPFEYDIKDSQIKALAKLFKSSYNKLDILDIIRLDGFLKKLSGLTKNEKTKDELDGISLLKNIDKDLLCDLITFSKNKNQITFLYNSPRSGVKEIELIVDKLSFKSERLYLWGDNLTHGEYSYFLVDRIVKICSIKLHKDKKDFAPIKVLYEIANDGYILEADEKLVEKTEGKLLIEVSSKNEFSLIQKFLYKADDCKIIEPIDFKTKVLKKLKLMEASYADV